MSTKTCVTGNNFVLHKALPRGYQKGVITFYCGSKGKFSYSTVSGPQDCSKRFYTLLPRSVHSDTISTSLGSIQPYVTINARRLLIHISTTVYNWVLIYTAERNGAISSKTNLPKVLTLQHRIRTRVLLVENPKLYP